MELDLKKLEGELAEYAGAIPARVHKHSGARVRIRETDRKMDIYINPKKVRSQGQLDEIVGMCHRSLLFGKRG